MSFELLAPKTVRPGIRIGNLLSALHGVIGVLMALCARGGRGKMVDLALYETVSNMMKGAVAPRP